MISDIKRKLIVEFTFSSLVKKKALDTIRLVNLSRLGLMLYIGFPILVIHVMVFYFNNHRANIAAQTWKTTLLFTHATLSIIFLIIGLLALLISKHKKQNESITILLPYITWGVLISAGAFIAGIDQMVTSAIAPFILVSILCALFLYMPPLQSGLFYALGYLILIIMLNLYQDDHGILLSNLVNGLTTIAIGWSLSVTLWLNQLRRIEKDLVIKNQQKELFKHNKELSENTLALKSSNNTKDKLFSIIAHDVRGPISNLNVILKLLNNGDISEEEFKGILPGLSQEVSQINELLENLLNWSRANLRNDSTKREVFNPKTIADEIVQLYKTQIDTKELNVNNNIKDSHLVYADKNMVQIVIRNLFSNAIKFSYTGGNISLNSTATDDFIHISVTDEGIGLPKEKIELLMTNDYNSTSGTKGEKGTGLGLVLCREFLEKNSGKLSITSIEGKGSVFSFSLPDRRYNEG